MCAEVNEDRATLFCIASSQITEFLFVYCSYSVKFLITQLEEDTHKRKLEKLQANMLEATNLLGVLEGELKQCRKQNTTIEENLAKQTAIIEKLRGGYQGERFKDKASNTH